MRRILASILFVICAFMPLTADASDPCTPSVLSSIAIQETTVGFDFNVSYPVLCAPKANAIMRDYVSTLMGEIKAYPPDPELGSVVQQYVCDAGYETSGLENGKAVSVALSIYAFTGGAHGNTWPQTWVFDLTRGELLSFYDMFKDGTLEALGPLVRGDLVEKLGEWADAGMMDDGLKPELHNFSAFTLNHEGVRFLFPPYQVAPYAAGGHEVTVPWAKLAPYLSDTMLGLLH